MQIYNKFFHFISVFGIFTKTGFSAEMLIFLMKYYNIFISSPLREFWIGYIRQNMEFQTSPKKELKTLEYQNML